MVFKGPDYKGKLTQSNVLGSEYLPGSNHRVGRRICSWNDTER